MAPFSEYHRRGREKIRLLIERHRNSGLGRITARAVFVLLVLSALVCSIWSLKTIYGRSILSIYGSDPNSSGPLMPLQQSYVDFHSRGRTDNIGSMPEDQDGQSDKRREESPVQKFSESLLSRIMVPGSSAIEDQGLKTKAEDHVAQGLSANEESVVNNVHEPDTTKVGKAIEDSQKLLNWTKTETRFYRWRKAGRGPRASETPQKLDPTRDESKQAAHEAFGMQGVNRKPELVNWGDEKIWKLPEEDLSDAIARKINGLAEKKVTVEVGGTDISQAGMGTAEGVDIDRSLFRELDNPAVGQSNGIV